MNKTITISGQTIELPFTEAEYQRTIAINSLDEIQEAFNNLDINQNPPAANAFRSYLAIGLHLAEKEKQDQVSKYKTEIDELNTEVDLLKEKVKELEGTILVRVIRANTNSL